MELLNEMTLNVKSLSINEGFVRSAIAAFCIEANPSLDEITDIKTAVSEAITNCVVHAYPNEIGDILIKVKLFENKVEIQITDYGEGIDNVEQAREPFYTTKPEQERSGMGFTVMESFMDTLKVEKNRGRGISVHMTKNIGSKQKQVVGA
ncbi:MAG: anti-sigma F factor [Clostridiales bacterium]|nr:anti-sigma F factor [Candidatus Apopatousia equi]